MALRKKKNKICRICHQIIGDNKGYHKIKEKIIYPDLDGNWWAMHKVYICETCVHKIREIVKIEA